MPRRAVPCRVASTPGNGLIDDQCDLRTSTATLGGGGACGIAPLSGGLAALGMALLGLARRRRSTADAGGGSV